MAYFPIFTQIEGKRCLIVGGGKVAARKVHTLLLYGADVVVIAPKVCEEIKEILPEGNVFERIYQNECGVNVGVNNDNTESQISCIEEAMSNDNGKTIFSDLEVSEDFVFEKEISKAVLVIAATSSRAENHRIAELCHAENILVNVADSEAESSFIFPSVVRKGDISIGINSGTGSPAVSKQIRKQIEKAVPDYYADIAVFMGELRQYVKANFKKESQRRYILKTAAAQAFSEERVLNQKEIEEIIRQGQK